MVMMMMVMMLLTALRHALRRRRLFPVALARRRRRGRGGNRRLGLGRGLDQRHRARGDWWLLVLDTTTVPAQGKVPGELLRLLRRSTAGRRGSRDR